MSPAEQQRYEELRKIASKIPPEASVAAGELEIPHVSSRLDAYTLKITAEDADFILLHKHHIDSDLRQRVRSAMEDNRYGIFARKGLFVLLKKNHQGKDDESALKGLGLWVPPPPAPRAPTPATAPTPAPAPPAAAPPAAKPKP
jgi:hypothetical protein